MTRPAIDTADFALKVRDFNLFGKDTVVTETCAGGVKVPTYVNEYWTSKQRAAHSIHEVSYRACFKPQLARFFIDSLSHPQDVVYDPFMGRGTAVIEASILNRRGCGCDLNPLSVYLTRPRLNPPKLSAIKGRLDVLKRAYTLCSSDVTDHRPLLTFYHPHTLCHIVALRRYLYDYEKNGEHDPVIDWIRMVALSRLTGHSPGFFSVYTLPPNQAVSVTAQQKINTKLKQTPPFRDIYELIYRKSKQLLTDGLIETDPQDTAPAWPQFLTQACASTPQIPDNSVDLVVTSPPFLDIVDYAGDNWLRCWFVNIDPWAVPTLVINQVSTWKASMLPVLKELRRVLKKGAHIAFEVGEVRKGSVKLEEAVIPCALEAGLSVELIVINDQQFTKTANCWGVSNNKLGTNTNRIVVLRKHA